MHSLFDGRSLEQKIEDAITLLKDNGYLVRGPLISECKVKSPSQLVQFFYDTLLAYRPNIKMAYAGNKQKELALAKKLIESRMKLGANKARAISESCLLIKLLFKYEPFLGLSFPVVSLNVLTSDNLSWVSERLWGINEGLNREVTREEDQAWWDSLYQMQEQNVDEGRLKQARTYLDRILDGNGKEE